MKKEVGWWWGWDVAEGGGGGGGGGGRGGMLQRWRIFIIYQSWKTWYKNNPSTWQPQARKHKLWEETSYFHVHGRDYIDSHCRQSERKKKRERKLKLFFVLFSFLLHAVKWWVTVTHQTQSHSYTPLIHTLATRQVCTQTCLQLYAFKIPFNTYFKEKDSCLCWPTQIKPKFWIKFSTTHIIKVKLHLRQATIFLFQT